MCVYLCVCERERETHTRASSYSITLFFPEEKALNPNDSNYGRGPQPQYKF